MEMRSWRRRTGSSCKIAGFGSAEVEAELIGGFAGTGICRLAGCCKYPNNSKQSTTALTTKGAM
jgi:hypothetical protein